MNPRRADLIRRIAADPAVPRRAAAVDGSALRWLGSATAIALLAILWRQSLPESALVRLAAEPVLVLELGLGLTAVLAAGLAAFRSGIPSATSPLRQAGGALLFGATWLALLAVRAVAGEGGLDPVPKRGGCWMEVMAYGAPGLLIGLAAVRRLWPLRGAWTGALLGFAAGAVPALLMYVACRTDAGHTLAYHAAPALALALAGGLLGGRWLRRP